MSRMPNLEITQTRSLIGATQQQRRTLRALGLRRIRQSVVMPDRPEIRGMVAKVAHLIDVAYPGDAEVLDLEPGQRPKGEGNPPAGGSVTDAEAAEAAEELEEALAEPGSVDNLGDLVDNPPTLETTDTPHKPKPRGGATEPDEGPDEPAPAQTVEIVDPAVTRGTGTTGS